jgi:hypothetical protein
MDIRQGNTIRFLSIFKDTSTTDARNWDEVDNVIIYAYTCQSYIVKFSLIPMSGYNPLRRIDSTHLLAAITPQQSRLMLGELMIELFIKDKGEFVIEGGYSQSTIEGYIDGGTSSPIPISILEGGTSEPYEIEEVGINVFEAGINITESIIKAEA